MLRILFGLRLKSYLLIGFLLFSSVQSFAQTYVYAQLQGSPINTAGWSLAGSAAVGNVTGTGNSELLLCPADLFLSGAVFFNQPINLSICKKWTAEFDFRIFDGSGADGIAFCFLDVPPAGFVAGGGLGIPGTANGLKVCFDPYLNCAPGPAPKLEIRWGAGYDECWAQPTFSGLSLIRSAGYNHAKITYNNGNIEVYINNTLYLTGFQQFNFPGYLGFTAATGGSTDNHSIKNVTIYTDMPPSQAGINDQETICSGQQLQIGTSANPSYVYTWTPATDLNSASVANPVATITNTGSADIVRKYYVQTAFNTIPGCFSIDSVTVTVKPWLTPSVAISSPANNICEGAAINFTASPTNGGTAPSYQWKINGANAGTNNASFSSNTLANGDMISCVMASNEMCSSPVTAVSNTIAMTVNPIVNPSVSITVSSPDICAGTNITFTAAPVHGGSSPSYQWKINGANAGTNSATFSSNTLTNGDIVTCVLTSNQSCITAPTAVSNSIAMTVNTPVSPSVNINASVTTICQGNDISFTATPVNGGPFPSYQWKINGVNAGANSPVFNSNTLVNNDIVSCEMTSSETCVTTPVTNSNTIPVTVRERLTPTINISASKENICSGALVDFTATTANGGAAPVYQWKINGANAGTNSATFSSNSLANGDIISCEFTSSEDCVTSSAAVSNTVIMEVNPFTTPSVNITASATTICRGDEVVFDATALDAGISPSYQWKLNGANVGTNDPVYTTKGLSGGDEVICVVTPGNNSCSIADVLSNAITIIIDPLPVIVILPADTIVKIGGQVQLNALIDGNIISYEWSPVSELTNPSSLSPVTLPLNASTDYCLKAISEDGCPVSKKVTVKVFNKLLMPNAFSPNKDGHNDVFRVPPDVPLTLKNFSIYDRWGQRLFFTTNINKGWDGTVSGAEMPSGVYIYMVNGWDDKGPVSLKGSFVLIR